MLESYEERRKKEREAEEEELRKLKEKQERRRLEREQEEREQAEKKRLEEERRRAEEEARRLRQEEEKRKKEEEKNKRQQMSGVSFAAAGTGGGRNFVIPTKTEKNDKFGNIVQAKQEMGMTKEQQEEAKKVFMIGVRNAIPEASGISASELKAKIKELHQRICKLETDKYDLEKRHERQENAGHKKGVDPSDANGRHPPKVQVFSKYDRQIDRRNFRERRLMYENKNAFPCFPGVPPPPTVFEKIFRKYAHEIQEDEDRAEDEQYDWGQAADE
ncbi:unnamed protein product [Heligmosomoides polygyrus]|uniref:Troponin T n=1 Tax=Heligmosomoides polygyrus TaxID=6339 RepID=A0A3P7Y2D1_HELPZ|nr:unnamed protein product [Heligmosomoides polygyrus]